MLRLSNRCCGCLTDVAAVVAADSNSFTSPPLHLISVANGVQLVGQIGLRKIQMMPRLPLTSLIVLIGGIWEDEYLFPVNKTARPFPPTSQT